MSDPSSSMDFKPEFYPKPEVPKGMERYYPFFLDSQMPSPLNSAQSSLSSLEAKTVNFEYDGHGVCSFPMTTESTMPDTKTKLTHDSGSYSAEQNDPPEITN
jgi:hypothetical protein